MATPKLHPMGITRKELHSAERGPSEPKSEKDYDKEVVRPELHLSGEHARMMGAEELKKGDRIRQTVEWVVGDHTKREENGKAPHYSMTLCLDKASDCADCTPQKKEDAEESDEGGEVSPAMAYITGAAAKSEA